MSTTSNRSRAVVARDAALERVRRTRRWVIVATAALTAGFAALVSALAPGRSLASKAPAATEIASASGRSATGASSASSAIPQLPPRANPGSLGLQRGGQSQPGGGGQSQPSTPSPSEASPPAQPSPPAAAPAPVAPPSSGGGGVVSGGS